MRVISLSTVFPNITQPDRGLFIHSRLKALAALVKFTVIAPVPVIDYSRRKVSFRHAGPVSDTGDRQLSINHPRWFYLPGTVLTILSLAARVAVTMARQRPFDLIDAHFGYPEGVAAAILSLLFRRPLVITLRGSELLHCKLGMRRALVAWALRKAARVIAVSNELARLARDLGVSADRIHVIPNGVDESRFFQQDRVQARRNLGMPLASKVILSAGHLIANKGHQYTIAAVGQLVAAGENVHLYIAGGVGTGVAPYELELRRMVVALGLTDRVHFLGSVEPRRMPELMAAANVFCLASLREGSPNVVLEALACGTPVVSTRVGTVPDLIQSEEYGYILLPADVPALREALHKSLSREWDHSLLSSFAQSRTWRQVAHEVHELFSAAIDTNSSPLELLRQS